VECCLKLSEFIFNISAIRADLHYFNSLTMPFHFKIFAPRYFLIAVLGIGTLATSAKVHAQDLEPRAYTNTPVGMNFLLIGYQNVSGALVFDPSLPITDPKAEANIGQFGYVRALDIAGKSAKVGVLIPYADLYADGYVSGEFRTREQTGLVDPSLYFTINLAGAPALSFKDFKDYQQDTIIGFTFKLTAPLGEYDTTKIINIGTNRWSFEHEFGITKAVKRWIFEAAIAAIFYTDNDDFDNGKTRQQDPIYSAQGHVIYSFANKIWAAVGVTYYTGGRTTIDGVTGDDLQQNWRTGFTVTFPVNRNHSVKVYGSSGVSTRTGTDYDSLGIAWQYRWGNGF
jgi:hypothetical protein